MSTNDSNRSSVMTSDQPFQYKISLKSLAPVFSIGTTVPQSYATRQLLCGTINPRTQQGQFTLDDNVFQNVTGTPSLGNGIGTVSFITGRDAIVVLGVTATTGPILPSSYLTSNGILYTPCPEPPSWLSAALEAIRPETLGIQKGPPVASSYYAPANTALQLSDPSLLPVISRIMVYPGPTQGTYVTYQQTAHNSLKSFLRGVSNMFNNFNSPGYTASEAAF